MEDIIPRPELKKAVDLAGIPDAFEDPPEEREHVAAARPVDRSTGVDVKVDWSLPEEELLVLAISIGNQAQGLRAKGQYADALFLYGKQREIREHVLGTEHEDTAETYGNIGVIYRNLGEYQTALKWYKKALSVQEKILGNQHPDTIRAYNNIADTYAALGDVAMEQFYRAKAAEAQQQREKRGETTL